MNTPWGPSQTTEILAEGVVSVTTASHGGIRISPKRTAELEAKFPNYHCFRDFKTWFEEDCDWSIIAIAWPEYFKPEHVEIARGVIKRYHPEININ